MTGVSAPVQVQGGGRGPSSASASGTTPIYTAGAVEPLSSEELVLPNSSDRLSPFPASQSVKLGGGPSAAGFSSNNNSSSAGGKKSGSAKNRKSNNSMTQPYVEGGVLPVTPSGTSNGSVTPVNVSPSALGAMPTYAHAGGGGGNGAGGQQGSSTTGSHSSSANNSNSASYPNGRVSPTTDNSRRLSLGTGNTYKKHSSPRQTSACVTPSSEIASHIIDSSWSSADNYRDNSNINSSTSNNTASGANANLRRNTSPQPPSQPPSSTLFRRTFSANNATDNISNNGGNSPCLNMSDSSHSNAARTARTTHAIYTPPPSAPPHNTLTGTPHAASVPRDRRLPQPTASNSINNNSVNTSRNSADKDSVTATTTSAAAAAAAAATATTASAMRGPKPKAPFYVRSTSPSATPSSSSTPSTIGSHNSGGSAGQQQPLQPQGSRSGIPRSLATVPPRPTANTSTTTGNTTGLPSPQRAVPGTQPRAASTSPARATPTPTPATGRSTASSLDTKETPQSRQSPQPRVPNAFGAPPSKSAVHHPAAQNTNGKSSSTVGKSPPRLVAAADKQPVTVPRSTPAANATAPPQPSSSSSASSATPTPTQQQQQKQEEQTPTSTRARTGTSRLPPKPQTGASTQTKPRSQPYLPVIGAGATNSVPPAEDLDLSGAADIINPLSSLAGFTPHGDTAGVTNHSRSKETAKANAEGTGRPQHQLQQQRQAEPLQKQAPQRLQQSAKGRLPPLNPSQLRARTSGFSPHTSPGAVPAVSLSPKGFQQRPRQPSVLANHSSVRPPESAAAGTDSKNTGGSSRHNKGVQQKEAAALANYLGEEELNLSMSTFTTLGTTLSHSLALRVLNLRGSTMPSEGLRGLADIPTLQSICVSHMRKLTSLEPLITLSTRDLRCGLQEIDAQCTPLRNNGVVGLERLPRLRKLDLSMTSVTDVCFLASSHSLQELYLAVTQVTSEGIRGLERIPTLMTLNVSRSKVTSLRSLVPSRSLRTLIAYSCKATDEDISGLEKMPRLTTIDLSTTKVTDLSIFRDSQSLKSIKAQWLSLKNCVDLIQDRRANLADRGVEGSTQWKDSEAGYSGLAEVPTLETVDLSFNTLRSVRTLCNSNSIKHLFLRRTKVDSAGIADIQRLARTLETLEITNLTDNMDESFEEDGGMGSASNISAGGNGLLCNVGMLATLVRLARLDLSFTDVYDLRILRSLPQLRELIIVETLVTVDGLRGIEAIPSLELLDLSQTSVMSLQFLAGGAPSLKKVLVRSNRNVRGFRLGHIEGLKRLESLDISDTVVEDIRIMWTPAWHLKELIWRWRERREAAGAVPSLACWVTSERLVGLASMPSLERLDLTNSAVHSLDFLLGAPRIKSLNLDGCRLLRDKHILSISNEPFVEHTLESLNLANNPHFTDLTCLRHCKRLQSLCIANDTGLHAPALEGVWNLPTIKELDITNSGAEEALWFSQQALAGGAAAEAAAAAIAAAAAADDEEGRRRVGRTGNDGAKGGGRGNGASSNKSSSNDDGDGEDADSRSASKRRESRSRRRAAKEQGTLRDVSAVLDSSVAPAEFRVARRRRVSFIAADPTSANVDGDGSAQKP